MTNAGRHPELAELAAGLAEDNLLREYCTSLSWASDEPALKVIRHLGWVPRVDGLGGRELPAPLTRDQVSRVAQERELLYQALLPLSQARSDRALVHRTLTFDRRAARRQTRLGAEAVIAQCSAALSTFRSARAAHRRTILNYPIAHHHWVADQMRRERKENPTWAPFLQGDALPEWRLRRMDDEIRLADHVLVPSTFVASTFAHAGVPRSKLWVVSLGTDVRRLHAGRPPANSEGPIARQDAEEFIVLFAGQITQRKGISYLIDAFRQAALPKARLALVGRPHNGIMKRLTGEERVSWLGSVPREQLGAIYRAADVLVLPSLAEGFPLVAIEAMACGTPTIVSENTFGHDVIIDGENGFVVPARDVDGLAERLRAMYSDRAATNAMGRRAAETAQLFTWARYRAETAQLIRRAAAA